MKQTILKGRLEVKWNNILKDKKQIKHILLTEENFSCLIEKWYWYKFFFWLWYFTFDFLMWQCKVMKKSEWLKGIDEIRYYVILCLKQEMAGDLVVWEIRAMSFLLWFNFKKEKKKKR